MTVCTFQTGNHGRTVLYSEWSTQVKFKKYLQKNVVNLPLWCSCSIPNLNFVILRCRIFTKLIMIILRLLKLLIIGGTQNNKWVQKIQWSPMLYYLLFVYLFVFYFVYKFALLLVYMLVFVNLFFFVYIVFCFIVVVVVLFLFVFVLFFVFC